MSRVPKANDAKAYLKARTFAKLDALRNLLMVIEHVHIDSHTVGADFEAQSDTIRAEVRGIVKGAQVISEREIRKGRDTMVEVTVSTRMYGDQGIARAFLPEAIERQQERAPEPAPVPTPAPVNHAVRLPCAPGHRHRARSLRRCLYIRHHRYAGL